MRDVIKNVIFAVFLVLLFTMQKSISFFGFALPLSFIFVICIAKTGSTIEAIIWGAIVGLLVDISAGFPTGQNGIIYMLIACGANKLSMAFMKKKPLTIMIFFFFSSIIYNAIMLIVSLFTSNVGNLWVVLANTFLVDGVITSILGLALYYLMEPLHEYIKL
ncbi:rod shape-determining protein MreD [Treponema sp. R6D11]